MSNCAKRGVPDACFKIPSENPGVILVGSLHDLAMIDIINVNKMAKIQYTGVELHSATPFCLMWTQNRKMNFVEDLSYFKSMFLLLFATNMTADIGINTHFISKHEG